MKSRPPKQTKSRLRSKASKDPPHPSNCPHLLFWTPWWLGANSRHPVAHSCLWAFASVSLLHPSIPAIPFYPLVLPALLPR